MDKLGFEVAQGVGKSTEGFRVHALDGLRGWASLAVASFHLVVLPLGIYVPGLMRPIPYAFANGELAVTIFFVMSGLALSIPFWKSSTYTSVLKLSSARYIRITIPIIGACFLANAMIYVFGNHASLAGRILDSPMYMKFDQGFLPWLHVAFYSTVLVYIHPDNHTPIPFLWTMRTELFGSFFLFVTFLVGLRTSHVRSVLFVSLVFLAAIGLNLAAFFVGALVGYLLVRTDALRPSPSRVVSVAGAAAILAMIFVMNALRNSGHSGVLVTTIFATAIIVVALKSLAVRQFLSNRLSLFLGAVSFPLYLTHYVVFTAAIPAAIIAADEQAVLTPWLALLISVSGVALALGVAVVFMPVERFSISLSRQFSTFATARVQRIFPRRFFISESGNAVDIGR